MELGVSLKDRRLMLAIPAYDGKLSIEAAYELPRLAAAAGTYGFQLDLAQVSGCSIITKARNQLVKEFLQSPCTDLLFLDADMTFKTADVLRLLALSADVDVVAGAYTNRNGEYKFYMDFDREDGRIQINDLGLVKVSRVGTGFMMIRRHVIETIISDMPELKYHSKTDGDMYAVFDFERTPEGYFGEDFVFCDRVRKCGMSIWLDPETNLGHYGSVKHEANFVQTGLIPALALEKKAA